MVILWFLITQMFWNLKSLLIAKCLLFWFFPSYNRIKTMILPAFALLILDTSIFLDCYNLFSPFYLLVSHRTMLSAYNHVYSQHTFFIHKLKIKMLLKRQPIFNIFCIANWEIWHLKRVPVISLYLIHTTDCTVHQTSWKRKRGKQLWTCGRIHVCCVCLFRVCEYTKQFVVVLNFVV